jgi:hypothetical protein
LQVRNRKNPTLTEHCITLHSYDFEDIRVYSVKAFCLSRKILLLAIEEAMRRNAREPGIDEDC